MCDFVLSGSEPLGTQSPHSRSLLGPPSARGGLRPPPAPGNCPENYWICEWAAPTNQQKCGGSLLSWFTPQSNPTARCVLLSLNCVQLLATYGLSPSGSSVHGDSPGKNTGVGVMPSSRGSSQLRNRTRVLNPGLLHCKRILYCLSHQGSPICPNNMPLSSNDISSNRILYCSVISATLFHILVFREITFFPPVIIQTKKKKTEDTGSPF